jgi:hypothetical protein
MFWQMRDQGTSYQINTMIKFDVLYIAGTASLQLLSHAISILASEAAPEVI